MPVTPPLPNTMARQLPSVVSAPVQVEPAALAAAARSLERAADSLGSAMPILGAAWGGAARVLMQQRTGAALHACQPLLRDAIEGCLDAMESYGQAMRGAAVTYRHCDRVAAWTAW